MTQRISLPQLPWHGPKELILAIPENWRLEICNFAGHNTEPLRDDQIGFSLHNLIGKPSIRQLAKGKKEVVILFDDMYRVTRISKIVPFILEELALAGIPDDNIRFLCANGTHAPLLRSDFSKKLGDNILSRYFVYNHNPLDNCAYLGETSFGTKVFINAEYMNCDFRIAIGSITPHIFMTFSGGGKIILPGISSIESILANHLMPITLEQKASFATNPRRLDLEEAARMAELDILVECVLNGWGETTQIFAGDPVLAHAKAFEKAKDHYLTKKAIDKDIVIANMYAKSGESQIAFKMNASIIKSGGVLVIIDNAPDGDVTHYHYNAGHFGKNISGKNKMLLSIPEHVSHIILFSQYPDKNMILSYTPRQKVIPINDWENVIKQLMEWNGKEEVGVAVYPNADLAFFDN